MEAWISQRAEEDRRRKLGAQNIGAQAQVVLNELRAAIRSCVTDFNALYREEPGRQVECVEDGNEMTVSLKSRPELNVQLKFDASRGLVTYRTSRNHQSLLAAEMLIFAGLTDSDEVFHVALDETGAPSLKKAGKRLNVDEVSESILGQVLFPPD